MSMKNRLPYVLSRAATTFALTAISSAMLVSTASAQNARPRNAAPNTSSSDTDKSPYDKHDLSGVWTRAPRGFKLPACPECGDPPPGAFTGYGYLGTPPPRTPAGEKKMQANIPARGYEVGSKEAKEHTEIDIGFRRAVLPAFSNDPEGRCEPLGLARAITFSGGGASMEMVQAKDRIIQKFEWTWDNRDIWLDGRELPKPDSYLPRFNGFSVGKWEGDTLVVTSTGFDDRQWVDQFGFPISDKMVLEERWDRPSPNRLRARLTITDPAMYTAPWQSSTKVWALVPAKDAMSIEGWSGIQEDRCVPTDESFFDQFRDRAAGKK
jgi:hypothetical protein